jgi:PAS domain S-box-containing protein
MGLQKYRILLFSNKSEDYAWASRRLGQIAGPRYDLEWVAKMHLAAILSSTLGETDVCLVFHDPKINDGVKLACDLRANNPRLPVIIIATSYQEKDNQAAQQAGVADFLVQAETSPGLLERAVRYASERARLGQALEESEARYHALVERTADIIYTLDLSGNFTSLNQAGERVTGYTRHEVLQMNLSQVLPPEHLDLAQNFITGKLKPVSHHTQQFDIITKSGVRVPVEANTHLIYQRRKPVGAQGIARDISQRRAAENALRETNNWLNALINASPLAIYVLDMSGCVQMWNPAAEHLFGWREEETLGHPLPTVPPEQESEFAYLCQKVIASQQPVNVECQRRNKAGALLTVSISAAPVRDESGQLVGLIGMVADLTEQRRIEENLHRSAEKLRQVQKMEAIGRLAGGIAHDFNNLLTVIRGYSELARSRNMSEDIVDKALAEITKASDNAAALIHQLLAFSRQQVLHPVTLNLNRTINDISTMLGRLIGENIEFHTSLTANLDNVRADPGQMTQVLVNLVVNARQAMPDGGQLTIATQNVRLSEPYIMQKIAMPPGPYVLLSVTDTGCGMDAMTQERIFEPFFTTKAKGEGTGLGLATTYGIVKQSGGYIWVYSEPGHGTTFKIYLPGSNTQEDANAVTKHIPEPFNGSETILLVEDEASLRTLAEVVLTSYGYQVLPACNGQDALEQLSRHTGPLDLVLTDVIMPGMNVRELTEHCSELRPEAKFLYISGYPDESIARHGVLNPNCAFLQKPFTAQALAAKVHTVLHTSLNS